MLPWLLEPEFPPIDQALKDPNGLLAAGGELSVEWLLKAYQRGIFPWFNEDDPILWWSPDPRLVLYPERFKLHRSLRQALRQPQICVAFDDDFTSVMRACAEPRNGHVGTWITDAMIAAYQDLFNQGVAHCVSVYDDNTLIGGLYGIALGCMFYGESMFSRRSNASKIALAHTCYFLHSAGYSLIDCQMRTDHLVSLGAEEISRKEFGNQLAELTGQTVKRGWREYSEDELLASLKNS